MTTSADHIFNVAKQHSLSLAINGYQRVEKAVVVSPEEDDNDGFDSIEDDGVPYAAPAVSTTCCPFNLAMTRHEFDYFLAVARAQAGLNGEVAIDLDEGPKRLGDFWHPETSRFIPCMDFDGPNRVAAADSFFTLLIQHFGVADPHFSVFQTSPGRFHFIGDAPVTGKVKEFLTAVRQIPGCDKVWVKYGLKSNPEAQGYSRRLSMRVTANKNSPAPFLVAKY